MKKYISFLLFLLLSGTFSLQAQLLLTRIEQDALDKGITLPPGPWHLADLWWEFDTTSGFKQLDIDVRIDRDVPEDVNLYIAPLGLAQLNGISCYGGFQTHIGGWPDKKSRQMVHGGKGGIFSRWSKSENEPIGLEYVDLLPGGYCESNGYEGEFCSVRRPYSWKAGHYTLSLIKEETITFKNAPHTWFSLNIRSHENKKTVKIGRLLFEGETFTLGNQLAAFVEVYGQSDIPEVTVIFGYPRINGKRQELKNAYAYRPTEGIGAAPNCAEVNCIQDQVSIKIGPVIQEKEFPSSLLREYIK